MKKLAKTFLKVGKIIGLIAVIGCGIGLLVTLILLIVAGVAAAAANATGDADAIAAGAAGVAAATTSFVSCLIWTAVELAGLILNVKATQEITAAQCKACAKKGAIMAIISGALSCTVFAAVSGVFCLVMSEEQFKSDLNEAPVAEAAPAEAVVEAEVVEAKEEK